jgi:hypothetical protein
METNYLNQEKLLGAADSESGISSRDERPGEGKLVRQLKSRHVAMIRYAKFPSKLAPTLVNNY